MTRVPTSFYFSVLAGLIVVFNHCAASETGDVALNKVTGAIGRFSILFHNTAVRLGTALYHPDTPNGHRYEFGGFGPLEELAGTMTRMLPHDTATYLHTRYCDRPTSGSSAAGNEEDVTEGVGTTTGEHEPQPHGGTGCGSAEPTYTYARAYHRQSRMQAATVALAPQTLLRRHDIDDDNVDLLGYALQIVTLRHHDRSQARALGEWFGGATVTVGVLLLRTCAVWWWHRAPLKVTGALLGMYVVLWSLGHGYFYLFGAYAAKVPLFFVTSLPRVFLVGLVDFRRCIQWEAQRFLLSDVVTVMMMELTFGLVKHACACLKK